MERKDDADWDPSFPQRTTTLPPKPIFACYQNSEYQSTFLTMRDGVRVAVDIMLPPEGSVDMSNGIPCVFHQTRYHRGMKLRWALKKFLNNKPLDFINLEAKAYFLAAGYAVASLDVRGTGASYGQWRSPWSVDEQQDSLEVVEHLTKQAWSNGQVVLYGISYDANAALFTTSHHPSAVRAAAALYPFWDLYRDVSYPGGIPLRAFAEHWSSITSALDNNNLDMLPFAQRQAAKMLIRGCQPVVDYQDQHMVNSNSPEQASIGAAAANSDALNPSSTLPPTSTPNPRNTNLPSIATSNASDPSSHAVTPSNAATPPNNTTPNAPNTPTSNAPASTDPNSPDIWPLASVRTEDGNSMGSSSSSQSAVEEETEKAGPSRKSLMPKISIRRLIGSRKASSAKGDVVHVVQDEGEGGQVDGKAGNSDSAGESSSDHDASPEVVKSNKRVEKRAAKAMAKSRLKEAVGGHNSWSFINTHEALRFSDQRDPNVNLTSIECSPCSVADAIASSNVPLLLVAGWMDNTVASVLHAWTYSAGPGSELIIGPWAHAGVTYNAMGDHTPESKSSRFITPLRAIAFFDRHCAYHPHTRPLDLIISPPQVNPRRSSFFTLNGARLFSRSRTTPPPEKSGTENGCNPGPDEPVPSALSDPLAAASNVAHEHNPVGALPIAKNGRRLFAGLSMNGGGGHRDGGAGPVSTLTADSPEVASVFLFRSASSTASSVVLTHMKSVVAQEGAHVLGQAKGHREMTHVLRAQGVVEESDGKSDLDSHSTDSSSRGVCETGPAVDAFGLPEVFQQAMAEGDDEEDTGGAHGKEHTGGQGQLSPNVLNTFDSQFFEISIGRDGLNEADQNLASLGDRPTEGCNGYDNADMLFTTVPDAPGDILGTMQDANILATVPDNLFRTAFDIPLHDGMEVSMLGRQTSEENPSGLGPCTTREDHGSTGANGWLQPQDQHGHSAFLAVVDHDVMTAGTADVAVAVTGRLGLGQTKGQGMAAGGEVLRRGGVEAGGEEAGVDDSPIHFFVMGSKQVGWQSANCWPPSNLQEQPLTMFLGYPVAPLDDEPATVEVVEKLRMKGQLSVTASSVHARFEHKVDKAKHPKGISRYRAITEPHQVITYKNLDKCGHLMFDSGPLGEDVEFVGWSIVDLWVESSDSDADVFAYLQDYNPATKQARYITEGMMRVSHRREYSEPPLHSADSRAWFPGVPYHTFAEKDVLPMQAGQAVRCRLTLLPTAYRVAAGHVLRLSVCGADAAHFTMDHKEPRTMWVHVGGEYNSCLQLPVVG